MITTEDFVYLPFTDDISEAAIVHMCRSLPRLGSGFRATGSSMRRSIAATSAQLALRRYLTKERVDFGVSAPPTFAQHEAPNVMVDRRIWALKPFLISRREQVEALADKPALVLQAPALVPTDRLVGDALRADDILLFALVNAPLANPPEGRQDWIVALPSAWRRPGTWVPLGPLIVKSEARADLWLELGGETGSRDFQDFKVRLASRERQVLDAPLHSLSYLRAAERPTGRIGLRSTARGTRHLISPADWENVWLEGRDICVLGWITRQEFSVRARPIREGARVFQFAATKVQNLAVDVSSLKPLHRLVDRSRP